VPIAAAQQIIYGIIEGIIYIKTQMSNKTTRPQHHYSIYFLVFAKDRAKHRPGKNRNSLLSFLAIATMKTEKNSHEHGTRRENGGGGGMEIE